MCIEGPQFSTRAESNVYRRQGFDIIGMTNLQEAKLAREAELCYAAMVHITDYDVWHEAAGDVSVELVIQTMHANLQLAQQALVYAVRRLAGGLDDCACHHALDGALITDPARVPEETLARLWPVVGKYYPDRRPPGAG